MEKFNAKYGVNDKELLLFAVGDGNHSLATAKTCWEDLKKSLPEQELKNHPARYALIELVNLHDDSLEFEAIHRLIFGVNKDKFKEEMCKFFANNGLTSDDSESSFEIISDSYDEKYVVTAPESNLPVGEVQRFIDYYIKNVETSAVVDYIHGEDVVRNLVKTENAIGILLPVMQKNELFATVIKDGVLPRKTFSMGEANDKRFYLEARKIK